MTKERAEDLLKALAKRLEADHWGDVPSSVAWEIANTKPVEYSADTQAFVSAAVSAWATQ